MLDTEYWAGRDAGYTDAQTDHQTDRSEGTPEYREGSTTVCLDTPTQSNLAEQKRYRHGVFVYRHPTRELVGAGAPA